MCLSCFGNGNKKAELEDSPRGLQKTWIVKIILGQFSHIRGALLTRLQKLETPFLQRTRKSDTSVFVSFLGVSILFHNLPSAQKNRHYRVRSTSGKPTPHHKTKRPNASQNIDAYHNHNSSCAIQQQVISSNIIRSLCCIVSNSTPLDCSTWGDSNSLTFWKSFCCF